MLSAKQQKVFDYIKRHIQHHGYAPSIREIKEELQYRSTSPIHELLVRIEAKGYIKRVGPRAIKILKGD